MQKSGPIVSQRVFLESIAKRIGISRPDDWYEIKESDVHQIKQSSISLLKSLTAIYPNKSWKLWKFKHWRTPPGFWKNKQNQLDFFANFAQENQFTSLSDWYKYTSKEIGLSGGSGLLRVYNDSLPKALSNVYPEFPWKPWLFQNLSPTFWKEETNTKLFLEYLAEKQNIKNMEDWYKVSENDIDAYGGGPLLKLKGSIFSLLSSVFPEHKWRVWRFGPVPDGFWKNKNNRLEFVEDLEKMLQIKTPEDWYKVRNQDVIQAGGEALLKEIQYNLCTILNEYYQKQVCYPWLFPAVPDNFWKDKSNHRLYFDWLAKELEIKQFEDWYSVSLDEVKNGFHLIKTQYESSLAKALISIYPEYPWKVWKFPTKMRWEGFWKDKHIQKAFLDDYAREAGIISWREWKRVSMLDMFSFDASGLIRLYDNSMYNLLCSIYPEHPWKPWMFVDAVPNGYWTEKTAKEFVDWVNQELHILELDEWYLVTVAQINSLGGHRLLRKYGGVIQLVAAVYPNYPWFIRNDMKSPGNIGKVHRNLFKMLQQLLPNETDIHLNYPHPDLKFKNSNKMMQLDVFIPKLNLAFEYHGFQHYKESTIHHHDFEAAVQRDMEKKTACSDAGITLIEIPYWWDETISSLAATIQKFRPTIDLRIEQSAIGLPISEVKGPVVS